MNKKFKFIRYSITSSFIASNVIMILLFIFSKWPKYWEHINYEYSHLTWLSSVNLILTGVACVMAYILTELKEPSKNLIHRFIIGVLGLGFIFLSLDEKFQIHEKLREKIFIPNNVGTEISGVGAGDFTHIIFAIIGLGISYFIIKRIKISKLSVGLYASALVTALISVITDATNPVVRDDSQLSQTELMQSINHQFTEELFESAAIICFAACFINYFFAELKNIMPTEDA